MRNCGEGGRRRSVTDFFLSYTFGIIRDFKYPKVMKQCRYNALMYSTLN